MEMDDPSRILAQAREHLEALKQSGLSRDALLALLEEEPQQQHQLQQPLSPPPPPPSQNVVIEVPGVPNFGYRDATPSFNAPPHYRSSMSTVSSSSSLGSCFSSHSPRSSVSSTTGPTSEAKFWCTSCDKTFKRKFDWKRHEEEFHERWRKYPCPNCTQSFWGPNTFNQHHKSAHGCTTCPHADTVVKFTRKRKAYGCGFCAGMNRQFERHIDHVAGHFEAGNTKADWLHSNVIYGLLHQHGIHEAWKALNAKKQGQYNGHQPMFSWSPESTGRAQGYVENESPGQLQDLLEFFDGSREAAEKIVQLADTCAHVVLRPRSGPLSPEIVQMSNPSLVNNSHNHVSVLPKTPRRTTSTSAILRVSKSRNRVVSMDTHNATSTSVTSMSIAPSLQPLNEAYQNFLPGRQAQAHATYVDKALPPAPLEPVSPMQIDFSQSFNHLEQGLLPTPSFPNLMDDWQSFASTLVEDRSLGTCDIPMTWDDLGQFETVPEN